MSGKKEDLAGPGIGSYEELEKILPDDYHSILNPKDHGASYVEIPKLLTETGHQIISSFKNGIEWKLLVRKMK